MKHFIDKIGTVGTHYVQAGVIVNSKGEMVGRVAIRFTKSNIGHNKEAGLVLNYKVKAGVDYSVTAKTNTYGTPLHDLFTQYGLKTIDHSGACIKRISTEDREIGGFTIDNEAFTIFWAC